MKRPHITNDLKLLIDEENKFSRSKIRLICNSNPKVFKTKKNFVCKRYVSMNKLKTRSTLSYHLQLSPFGNMIISNNAQCHTLKGKYIGFLEVSFLDGTFCVCLFHGCLGLPPYLYSPVIVCIFCKIVQCGINIKFKHVNFPPTHTHTQTHTFLRYVWRYQHLI